MNKVPDKRKVLGKGLAALLPPKAAAPPSETASENNPGQPAPLTHLPVDQIRANPLQPRTVFDEDRIAELSQSILANGIIQPLIVRHHEGRYELIAGERRLRAAKMAGLKEVPVVVQNYADEQVLEVALIENIQREDLNPIETAQALDRMARELDLSHDQIASRTGKDRPTISNFIRLL